VSEETAVPSAHKEAAAIRTQGEDEGEDEDDGEDDFLTAATTTAAMTTAATTTHLTHPPFFLAALTM
jgi:hypothetical protein